MPIYNAEAANQEQFRPELKELGKFRQVPLRTLDYAAICGRVDLQFVSPIGIDTKLSDPWNPSCMVSFSFNSRVESILVYVALQVWTGEWR